MRCIKEYNISINVCYGFLVLINKNAALLTFGCKQKFDVVSGQPNIIYIKTVIYSFININQVRQPIPNNVGQ